MTILFQIALVGAVLFLGTYVLVDAIIHEVQVSGRRKHE